MSGYRAKAVYSGVSICTCIATLIQAGAAAEPGVIINEDNSHFFGSRTAEQMTLEGLQGFVDQYAQTAVSHLFLCPNAKYSYVNSTLVKEIARLGGEFTEFVPPGVAKALREKYAL